MCSPMGHKPGTLLGHDPTELKGSQFSPRIIELLGSRLRRTEFFLPGQISPLGGDYSIRIQSGEVTALIFDTPELKII